MANFNIMIGNHITNTNLTNNMEQEEIEKKKESLIMRIIKIISNFSKKG